MIAAVPAQAITIDSVLTPLGGIQFRLDYTLGNDGSLSGSADVESLEIEFLDSLITSFSNLADWDEFTSPVLGNDLLALDAIPGPGIATGGILEFFVEFDWSGAGSPQPQNFTIFDLNTFDVLETGVTVQVDAPTSAPLPGCLGLLGLALGILSFKRRVVMAHREGRRSE